ncbi:1149_t:CDS:2 [Ambispora gerdemannii]|uniref:1149_t:CDS:1 n=1 Tax=Ambispora gerdemannii TaxID=144530 RepID=A0A9N9BX91_9GLOM|nr:1149_t:CDS:2 [Ambispora gerdemannii]
MVTLHNRQSSYSTLTSIMRTNTLLRRKPYQIIFILLLFTLAFIILFTVKLYNQEGMPIGKSSIVFDSEGNSTLTPTNITAPTSKHLDQEPKEEEQEYNNNSYVDLTIQRNYPFTITTAASSNHFCVLHSWIYNAQKTLHELNDESLIPRIIIYDLGLLNYQRSILKYLYNKSFFTELRQFNYTKYPDFWDINENRGEYAWKTGIVTEIANEFPGIVAWLDSGSIFRKEFLTNLYENIRIHEGFLSGKSTGRVPAWTHAGTFQYFNVKPARFRNYRNCNGAMIVFDTIITRPLIDAWYKCALVKDCIAPEGSNRDNHRQDQAILTLLAAMELRKCKEKPEFYGIDSHQDHHCKDQISDFERIHTDLRWEPTDEDLDEIEEHVLANQGSDEIYDVWTKYSLST